MIVFDNVTVSVPLERRKAYLLSPRREVLSGVNLQVPCDRRIALFASSGHEINMLMGLMSGLIVPTAGIVSRYAKVSFPAGHLGSFSESLSVRSNIAHFARLYGADERSLIKLIENAAHIGPAFDGPFARLPRVRQNIVSQIILFSIPFDMYLLGSAMPRPHKNGPGRYVHELFVERTRTAGFVVAAKDPELAKRECDMALVLHERKLHLFDDMNSAADLAHRAKRRGLLSAPAG